MAQKNIEVQKWIAILSVILLITKFVAYFLTHSVAILSDALEGIANIIAGFIGLYSLYIAAKPRDEDHPYGHGKVEFVSSGIEGSMILVASVMICYQAIKNLIDPQPLHQLDIGIIIIAAAGVVNYIAGMVCIRVGKQNGSVALVASGKHLQTDTFTTIGVVAGLIIVYFTHIVWIDSAVAIVFATIIMRTGYNIVRTSLAGIMDEYDPSLLVEVVKILNANRRENWVDLHNVRIIKYGNVLHLDGHLTVPWYLNVNEAHEEIDMFINLLRQHFGDTTEFFLHTDGCLESQCRLCVKEGCPVRKHDFVRRLEWTVENISSNKKHYLDA